MAIYHMSIRVGGRAIKGRTSAVNHSAYISEENLHNAERNETYDYSNKERVEDSFVLLPAHAPREYLDRETLWNAVEANETQADAQLYREFEGAFPLEFSQEDRRATARAFAQRLVDQGMCVDVGLHWHEDNPHFHAMATVRAIDENGEWATTKQKKVYANNIIDGRLVYDPKAPEGQRVPKYDSEKLKAWEQEHHRKFDFIRDKDDIPEVQKVGARGRKMWERVTVETQNCWDSRDYMEVWRKSWADICNDRLQEKGLDTRIDHRSYERQGIDRVPTIHEGPAVRRYVSEGKHQDRAQINYEIRVQNRLIDRIKQTIQNYENGIKAAQRRLQKAQRSQDIGIVDGFERVAIQEKWLRPHEFVVSAEGEPLTTWTKIRQLAQRITDAFGLGQHEIENDPGEAIQEYWDYAVNHDWLEEVEDWYDNERFEEPQPSRSRSEAQEEVSGSRSDLLHEIAMQSPTMHESEQYDEGGAMAEQLIRQAKANAQKPEPDFSAVRDPNPDIKQGRRDAQKKKNGKMFSGGIKNHAQEYQQKSHEARQQRTQKNKGWVRD